MSKAEEWEADLVTAGYVLGALEGTWRGEGMGGFPTVDSFVYRETLTFERRDEESLFYMQRTEKRMDGQPEFVLSHWESGFIHILAGNELGLANVQSGGRGEFLKGKIDGTEGKVRLDFISESLANDDRMVASARTFVIDGDRLQYEMSMQTTRVNKIVQHLKATLQRGE